MSKPKAYPVNLKSDSGKIYKAPIMRQDETLLRILNLLEFVQEDWAADHDLMLEDSTYHESMDCMACELNQLLHELQGGSK